MKFQVLINQTTSLPELKISYNADAPTNDERLLEQFAAKLQQIATENSAERPSVNAVITTASGVDTLTLSTIPAV